MPLIRSRTNRVFGGVCGGIAEWLGWDPTLVRVLYVVVSILSVAFPGILFYLVLWLIVPEEGKERPRPVLRRSRTERLLGGVCGGIAEWTGEDPSTVRVLYVLISILSVAFPGIIVYLILWLLIPEADPVPLSA